MFSSKTHDFEKLTGIGVVWFTLSNLIDRSTCNKCGNKVTVIDIS